MRLYAELRICVFEIRDSVQRDSKEMRLYAELRICVFEVRDSVQRDSKEMRLYARLRFYSPESSIQFMYNSVSKGMK